MKKTHMYENNGSGNGIKIIIILAVLAVIAVGVYYFLTMNGDETKDDNNSIGGDIPIYIDDGSDDIVDDSENDTDDTEKEDTTPSEPQDKEDNTSDGKTFLEQVAEDNHGAVPESEAVDIQYFDTVAFVGNSRTETLELYDLVGNADVFASRGVVLSEIYDKLIYHNELGREATIIDALSQKQYKNIYLMFGTNELGWPYPDVFAERYGEFIDEVRKLNPEANIYIQSILPLTAERSGKDETYTNEKISIFNEELKKLSAEKSVYYLDIASVVSDGTGALPDEASTDGIHLLNDYAIKWANYIKTHTVGE